MLLSYIRRVIVNKKISLLKNDKFSTRLSNDIETEALLLLCIVLIVMYDDVFAIAISVAIIASRHNKGFSGNFFFNYVFSGPKQITHVATAVQIAVALLNHNALAYLHVFFLLQNFVLI